MRLSVFFMPTLKEIPAEAQIASHRLMLRSGMVRQSGARSSRSSARNKTPPAPRKC